MKKKGFLVEVRSLCDWGDNTKLETRYVEIADSVEEVVRRSKDKVFKDGHYIWNPKLDEIEFTQEGISEYGTGYRVKFAHDIPSRFCDFYLQIWQLDVYEN